MAGVEQEVSYVQATTTVTDIGDNKLYRGGVPIGGIGAGKIDLTPDSCVTNITTNNNIEAPICDGHAQTPSKIVKGGVPSIFWAIWNDKDGAKTLKRDPADGIPGIPLSSIDFDGKLPIVDYRYREIGDIDVDLTAFSSLIIGDDSEAYKDSSLPAAVFKFTLKNISLEKRKYRLMFSWQNMIGTTGYYNEKNWGITDNRGNQAKFRDDGAFKGAYFYTEREQGKDLRSLGNYSLCVDMPAKTTLEYRTWKDIFHLWEQFSKNAPLFVGEREPWHHGADAVLAVSGELKPGEAVEIPYCVSWYFPNLVEENAPDYNYGHNYCNFFKDSWDVCNYMMKERGRLFSSTKKWQDMLWNSNLPEWFKYKMCDDLFPLYTSSWYTQRGEFSISEAVTNMGAMMGTIDQRNSSQAPYLMYFQKLCLSELNLFMEKQVLPGAKNEYGRHWDFKNGTSDENFTINQIGAVPHDIGHEDLRSYAIVPSYEWNAGHWPDLISGYILQWYAYMCWTDDANRKEIYNSMKLAEGFLRRLDGNGDGVPDLWGWGSSSYDNHSFPYYGIMPYCVTLYIAALKAIEKTARQMGENEYAKELLSLAKNAVEVLCRENWNGEYFKCWTHKEHKDWDNGPRSHGSESNSIHISQLAGQWYASMMGLGYVVPREKVDSVLKVLAENNHAKVSGAAPIEFIPATENAPESYGESWPHYATTYFIALSLYESQKDVAMEQFYKYWKVLIKNNARWDCGLGIAGKDNDIIGGRWYMTNTAGWFCLLALSGFWLDLPSKELILAPNLPESFGDNLSNIPVFAEKFKGIINYKKQSKSAEISFEIVEFSQNAILLESIKTRYVESGKPKTAELFLNGEKQPADIVFDDENGYIIFKSDISISKQGDKINIILK